MKSNLLFKLLLFSILFSLFFIISFHFYLSLYHKTKHEYLLQTRKHIKTNSIFFNYMFFQNNNVNNQSLPNDKCKIFNNVNNFKYSHDNTVNYPILLPLHQNNSINFKCLNQKISKNKRKTILIYNDLIRSSYFFKNDFNYGKKEKCPIKNCLITTNKSLMSSSDLVVFNLNDNFKLPNRVNISQLWAYFLYEPFDQNNFNKQSLNSLFNWSSTYMSDSTFFSFHYRNLNMEWTNSILNRNELKKPTTNKGLIATIINECKYYKDHLIYLNELKKYIQVDVYGKCGDFNYCEETFKDNYSHEKCLEYLSKNYKYYFAFETNVCDNYVTDKFFNVLKYDLVPIIFKSFDHDKYVPNSAYINVNKYSTAKSLADYILYLESNLTAYLNHFEWKKHIKFRDNNKYLNGIHSILCDMCIKLNLNDFFDELESRELSAKISNIDKHLKYDHLKSCYHLNWTNVLGFYYSDPFYEKTFIDEWIDFLFH